MSNFIIKTNMHHNRHPIKILADASLLGLRAHYQLPFELTYYQNKQELIKLLPTHDCLVCRSTLSVDEAILRNTSIQVVATASSGTDHIDAAYLRQHHITLFDAKGSNADAVADYVMLTINSLTQLNIPFGKKAGIIGVGEVGSRVVERLQANHWQVLCYDPIKAQAQKDFDTCTLEAITECDIICLHPNLHNTHPFPSLKLVNKAFLAQLKPGIVIINAARGEIVDEEALLTTNTPIIYCTDVYCNEPSINPNIVALATIATPHIAGHTIEAKFEAVNILSQKIHAYYELPFQTTNPIKCPLVCTDISTYDPLMDTQVLKTAEDKQLAFLTQRKAHHRHCTFLGTNQS